MSSANAHAKDRQQYHGRPGTIGNCKTHLCHSLSAVSWVKVRVADAFEIFVGQSPDGPKPAHLKLLDERAILHQASSLFAMVNQSFKHRPRVKSDDPLTCHHGATRCRVLSLSNEVGRDEAWTSVHLCHLIRQHVAIVVVAYGTRGCHPTALMCQTAQER